MPKFEATARQNPRKENLIALPNKVSAVPKYMDWTDDLPMSDTYDILAKIMKERIIIIIDGAMGTSILKYKSLTEADFRGEQWKNHTHDLKDDNDLLVEQPARTGRCEERPLHLARRTCARVAATFRLKRAHAIQTRIQLCCYNNLTILFCFFLSVDFTATMSCTSENFEFN